MNSTQPSLKLRRAGRLRAFSPERSRRITTKGYPVETFRFLFTAFMAILVPIYCKYYGAQNFLWFSDIGLFLTLGALWLHCPLLISIAAVGILAVELAWNIDFFSKLIFNSAPINLSDYMFDHHSYSILLRALSLFHVVMPIVWLSYLAKHGYDQRALPYAIILYWIILFLTYTCTDPKENINWVFTARIKSLRAISQTTWIFLLAFGFPVLVYVPTHLLLSTLFRVS